MKELNKKMLKNFRDNIAVSRLEEEFIMKRALKKQIITLSMFGILIISGGFLTVNAATGGELTEKVKDTIKIVFVNSEGKEEQAKGTTYKNSEEHTIEKYQYDRDGVEGTVEIDKTILEQENLSLKGEQKEDEFKMTIKESK